MVDTPLLDEAGITRQVVTSPHRGSHLLSPSGDLGEYATDLEGPAAKLLLGPGMVRLYRRDPARAERSKVRRVEADHRARVVGTVRDLLNESDGFVPADSAAAGRVISGWSAKSRMNLVRTIASLDLAPLVSELSPPAMVTLTLPGDWLAVAPDAAAAARAFNRWRSAYERRWDAPLVCIWKREFQRRGAPHWHLWLVPPADVAGFRSWLSSSWTRALGLRPPVRDVLGRMPLCGHCAAPHHRDLPSCSKCNCSEYCRSLHAGTGLDFSEGARARDPKRLAIYFLKESLGGEGKQYQNGPPPEWAGQSVGRYWGVRGIDPSLVEVELQPEWAQHVYRAMRRVRRVGQPTREQLVPRGFYRVTGAYLPDGTRVPIGTDGSVLRAAGEVRYRKVTRRRRFPGQSGWLAVNDGAAFGARLGQLVTALAADPAPCVGLRGPLAHRLPAALDRVRVHAAR